MPEAEAEAEAEAGQDDMRWPDPLCRLFIGIMRGWHHVGVADFNAGRREIGRNNMVRR